MNVPNPFEQEIQQFEAADRRQFPPDGGILFVGSSTITIWNATIPEDFAPLPAFGRGFGGSTIADSTYFAHRIVLPYRPKIIVLYAGENDLAGGKTPEQVCADFQEFSHLVQTALPATKLFYISMKPSLARMNQWEEMQRGNALIADICANDPRLGYIDIVPLLLDADGNPPAELYSDGLHMVRAGYARWVPVVRQYLEG